MYPFYDSIQKIYASEHAYHYGTCIQWIVHILRNDPNHPDSIRGLHHIRINVHLNDLHNSIPHAKNIIAHAIASCTELPISQHERVHILHILSGTTSPSPPAFPDQRGFAKK